MKYASTRYTLEKVSTCQIAGAVALCALHDLHVNLFRFGGFPQIVVEASGADFIVTISVEDEQKISSTFALSRTEAFNAANGFKKDKFSHDQRIFDRVQSALARVVG
jgi:hypothetical protein